MASHRLSADEAALWARVMAGVRPIGGRAAFAPEPAGGRALVDATVRHPEKVDSAPALRPLPGNAKSTGGKVSPGARPSNTLDGTWDRQLSRGVISPDRTVDLHGHTLSSAYALLDHELDTAVRSGDRTILLVTGKPPRPESERPHARGAIRAAVGDWLAGSRHATHIAAVRATHPRHGGAGALYIVLRKRPLPGKS